MDTLSQEEEEEEQEQEEDSTSEKSKKVDVKGFIEWFNLMKLKHNGSQGKFKTLSQTDINNLIKLKALQYTSAEWEHAFKMMCNSEWVQKNQMVTPEHFLANKNFSKYMNQEDKSNSPKFAWQ